MICSCSSHNNLGFPVTCCVVSIVTIGRQVKSAYEPIGYQAGACPGLCTMKQLGVFLLPLDGMLVVPRVIISIIHSINFADTPKYTPEWREGL